MEQRIPRRHSAIHRELDADKLEPRTGISPPGVERQDSKGRASRPPSEADRVTQRTPTSIAVQPITDAPPSDTQICRQRSATAGSPTVLTPSSTYVTNTQSDGSHPGIADRNSGSIRRQKTPVSASRLAVENTPSGSRASRGAKGQTTATSAVTPESARSQMEAVSSTSRGSKHPASPSWNHNDKRLIEDWQTLPSGSSRSPRKRPAPKGRPHT